MACDLSLLVPEFRERVEKLLEGFAGGGPVLRPYYGLRTPQEQARIWRQTRSREEVTRAMDDLKKAGAPTIADILWSVGPQPTNGAKGHLTHQLPMASWHQHGEALDCFVLRQGQAVWDGNDPSYKVYTEAARKFGCDAGYFWRMKDSVHIQLRTASVMAVHRSWAELDRLARKFI